jgi:hypothetical protein
MRVREGVVSGGPTMIEMSIAGWKDRPDCLPGGYDPAIGSVFIDHIALQENWFSINFM